MAEPPESVRAAYEAFGVEGWYAAEGDAYRNPHEDAIVALLAEVVPAWGLRGPVLDLACGSGEATLALEALGVGPVTGADPFTGEAYRARAGREAEAVRFEDVAAGVLEGRSYGLVVCSYALHLVAPSWLPAVCLALARVTPALLVVSPHKRPELRPAWGWTLTHEAVVQRVRGRLYRGGGGG